MKAVHGILIAGALALGWVLFDFVAHSRVSPPLLSNREYHQLQERQTKCRDARVLFFTECMKSALRENCESLWGSLHGHTFDGDPRNNIVDEIDCSTPAP